MSKLPRLQQQHKTDYEHRSHTQLANDEHTSKLGEIESKILEKVSEVNANMRQDVRALSQKIQGMSLDDTFRLDAIQNFSQVHRQELAKLSRKVDQILHQAIERDKERTLKKISKSLYFSLMTERHDHIRTAHSKTFRWFLHSDAGNSTLIEDSFLDWLTSTNDSQSSIYWICGKAGSGKSTLMQYLYDELKLQHFQDG